MIAVLRRAALAASGPLFLLAGVVAVGAERAPAPRELPKNAVLPESVFRDIVSESTGFILGPFTRYGPWSLIHPGIREEVIRSNALLIALAAQNRIGQAGSNDAKLATLRDAAVALSVVVAKNPSDVATMHKHLAVLHRYPDITPDPTASLAPVPLLKTFDHDEVASIFGQCGGNRTQRLEFHLNQLSRQKTPYTPAQAAKLELLAYKVALVGEILPTMTDTIHTPSKQTPHDFAEWARLGNEVRQTGWLLAETARGGDFDATKRAITVLMERCTNCHNKYRE